MELSGQSNDPRNFVERAGDEGLQAIASYCDEHEVWIERLVIMLQLKEAPDGPMDATTCGIGIEDAREMIAFLTGSLVQTAAQVGLQIHVVPLSKPMDI